MMLSGKMPIGGLALLAATSLLCSAQALPARDRPGRGAEPAHADPAVQALDRLLHDHVRSGKVTGIAAAIGRRDDPPTFLAAGHLSGDPGAPAVSEHSLWRIYSMTKPITAMAAMMLIEEGRLELDQPISDFLPAFGRMRVLVAPQSSLEARPTSSPITVRHLLTHSSGLTYPFLGTSPLHREYQRLGLVGGRAEPNSSLSRPATLAEFADQVAALPLLFDPGTKWSYSVASDVLGRVIEVASGQPFPVFVQERLLDPLAMDSTSWWVPPGESSRLSPLHIWTETGRVEVDKGRASVWLLPPPVHYGGSGLVSSARDYDRFLRLLAGRGTVDGVRLLKPETVQLALSNLLPQGVRVSGGGTPDTAMAEGFGAGGWIYLTDVSQGVGAGTFGWFGAAGTFAFIDPASGLRVTVMVNHFPATKWPLHRDVVRALYGGAR